MAALACANSISSRSAETFQTWPFAGRRRGGGGAQKAPLCSGPGGWARPHGPQRAPPPLGPPLPLTRRGGCLPPLSLRWAPRPVGAPVTALPHLQPQQRVHVSYFPHPRMHPTLTTPLRGGRPPLCPRHRPSPTRSAPTQDVGMCGKMEHWPMRAKGTQTSSV